MTYFALFYSVKRVVYNFACLNMLWCIMCLKVHVRECVLLFKCLRACVCDYKGWLIQMRNYAVYHTGTRHSECIYAFVSVCILMSSAYRCSAARYSASSRRTSVTTTPPPPHPVDYPPLTHLHILTFSPKHHTLAQAHIKSTRPRRERWDSCQIQLVSTDDCKRQDYHACALCWRCALSLQALHHWDGLKQNWIKLHVCIIIDIEFISLLKPRCIKISNAHTAVRKQICRKTKQKFSGWIFFLSS